jgi:arabinan endo-1,5-alpha-L-arabinosidase
MKTGLARWVAIVVLASAVACDDDLGAPEEPLAATATSDAGAGAATDARVAEDGAESGVPVAASDAGAADAALPPPVPYTNPVLNLDFADPSVVRGADRKLYAFATGGLLQRARSSDLVHWQSIGNALAAKPSWASAKNKFWAPHVTVHGGTYYLYFSAEQNAGTDSFCIGVATAPAPDAPFVDVGAPIVCGPSFVNIDPMVYDDPNGTPLLYWGSGFQPIRVQQLAADRVHLAPGSQPKNLLVTSPLPYERLLEGAWLHPHGGYFYLFNSGDDCCGSATASPHYAVMVSRAKSPTGPYEDFGVVTGAPDNTILVANARWLGPGHNAVIVDDAGTEWMVYHAFDNQNPGARFMLIDRITYVNGWPSIAGRTPSQGVQVGPVFRP